MFVCKVCGTVHEIRTSCCGEATVPIEEAIGAQEQLFELDGNDKAQHVMGRLKAAYEAAAQKVNKTEEKLAERMQRDSAASVLIDFYKLTKASDAPPLRGLMSAVVDEVNSGALDSDGVSVTATLRG